MFYFNNGVYLHKMYLFNVLCANNMPKYTMQILTQNLVTKSVEKRSKDTKLITFIEIKRFAYAHTHKQTLVVDFFF